MNSQNIRNDICSVGSSAHDNQDETHPFPILPRYRANLPPPGWRMDVLVRPLYTYRRATADHSTSTIEPSASASIQSSVSAEDT